MAATNESNNEEHRVRSAGPARPPPLDFTHIRVIDPNAPDAPRHRTSENSIGGRYAALCQQRSERAQLWRALAGLRRQHFQLAQFVVACLVCGVGVAVWLFVALASLRP